MCNLHSSFNSFEKICAYMYHNIIVKWCETKLQLFVVHLIIFPYFKDVLLYIYSNQENNIFNEFLDPKYPYIDVSLVIVWTSMKFHILPVMLYSSGVNSGACHLMLPNVLSSLQLTRKTHWQNSMNSIIQSWNTWTTPLI